MLCGLYQPIRFAIWFYRVCLPRFWSCRFLVLVADIIGVTGGYFIATARLGFHPGTYIQNTWSFLEAQDVISGLVKAAVFGFIIALMGCYHGYKIPWRSCRRWHSWQTYAVVSASILILISNYLVTELFFAQ